MLVVAAAGALPATDAIAQAVAAPATTAVPGDAVLAALRRGVARNPDEKDPYGNGCRKLTATDQSVFWLCGAMASWQVRGGFPGPSGLGVWARVAVEPVISGTTVQGVTANGIRFSGPTIDLAATNPPLDAAASTWSSGQWQVQLIVASVPRKPALMSVCWKLTLPPPPPVDGPPGFVPIVRTTPLARTMCSVHDRVAAVPDRGGYVIDDAGSGAKRYEGTW
ncbi:MAG: hypothetical protein AB7P21_24280 [Lautropia sp.]